MMTIRTPWPVARPGARCTAQGVEFAIRAPRAKRVFLLLFEDARSAEPLAELELAPPANREAGLWTALVPEAHAGLFYVYRMEGPVPDFDPEQWLLDPYALAIEWGRRWGETRDYRSGVWPKQGSRFPKGCILDDRYDWGDDRRPRIPWQDTIIYEVHLRGFTQHPSSGVADRGTYRGFIEKIPYLRELGITAVEFLPLTEFNEIEYFMEGGPRRALLNYWGYSPVSFIAPMSRYATIPRGEVARRELRELVRALHAAGIEVIVDIVLNHTGEWGERGPTWSFKGIDRARYYLLDPQGGFRDYSGCGNTFNANDPMGMQYALDALRHWAVDFHVDGFRFDLAAALCRVPPDGEPAEEPPFLRAIESDPILRDLKCIAEPWDSGGQHRLGRFPARWAEWNDAFRDDVRRFWAGHGVTVGRLATRLAGSSDLFEHNGGTPLRSLNYVTSHDGFTLADLVSYREKHNWANAEGNRDGHPFNYSVNHGIEGPTDDPLIQRARLRHMKNLLATLFLSQGVPMLAAGDEFGRTQRGNNNAYCQDNEISWIDWRMLEWNRELHEFVRTLIRFRRSHASLRRTGFFRGPLAEGGIPDVYWFGPDGEPPDWTHGRALGLRLEGRSMATGARSHEEHLLILINGLDLPVRFIPPVVTSRSERWTLQWTTAELEEIRIEPEASAIHVGPRSVSVFGAKLS